MDNRVFTLSRPLRSRFQASRPPPGLSKEGKNRNQRALIRAAWAAAREACADGALFWDNCKVRMPAGSLHTLILEALRRGLDWKLQVRPALEHAVHEAHAAACLSGTIRNPGAFAAAIFRTVLQNGKRRPVISHRPPEDAQERREQRQPALVPQCIAAASSLSEEERTRVRAQAAGLAAAMRVALRRPAVP